LILVINRRFAEGVNFITTLNYFVNEIRSIKCVRLCESHSCLSRSACLAVRQASMAGLMLRKFRNKIVRSLDFCSTLYQDKVECKVNAKLVQYYEVIASLSNVYFNTSQLKNGVYMVNLYCNNRLSQSSKLVIIK